MAVTLHRDNVTVQMPALDLPPADAAALAELLALAARLQHLHPQLAQLAGINAQPRSCAVCSAPLLTDSPRATTCSDRCRRALSRRNKAARLAAGGGQDQKGRHLMTTPADGDVIACAGDQIAHRDDLAVGSIPQVITTPAVPQAVVSDNLTSPAPAPAPHPPAAAANTLADAVTDAVAEHGSSWPRGLAAAIARQFSVSPQAVDQRKKKAIAALG